jgi:RNA polymerase sigma factor (sigma-70 family)
MFFRKTWTEEELIDGCRQNNRQAQEAFYKKFFPEMLRMSRRYTHSDDTSTEILNTAFLKVFQKIDTYTYSGSLEGWVRRIVHNCIADYYRVHGRYQRFIVFEETPNDASIAVHQNSELEEKDLMRLIDRLPNTSAQVFKMYALEGFSHAEIAETLHMSEGNSKWHLFQARKKLKESLILSNGTAL